MQQVVSFLPSPPGRLTHLGHGSAALHGAGSAVSAIAGMRDSRTAHGGCAGLSRPGSILLSTDPLCSFQGAAQPADWAACPHMPSGPVFRDLVGR
jgi:hypothetical protein